MKPLSTYLTKLSGILCLFLILQSCTENAGVWKNGQISEGKREDFHNQNNEILKLLKANDRVALRAFFCKELNDENYTDRTVASISDKLTEGKYAIFDEYYVVNQYLDQDTITASGKGINSYGLVYPGTTRDMYMVFFKQKDSENAHMISLIYAKYNYGWKISQLDVAPYSINGKTGPELFKLAQENYKNHYLIDAIDNVLLGSTCLDPGVNWQYAVKGDMHEFSEKLMNEANTIYKYPYPINGVPTEPKIIKVYNKTNDEGSFPNVCYLSKIKLADTVALKQENEQVKAVIGKIMPGIDKGKKYLYYSIYNEKPVYNRSVEHFDVMQKL